MERRAASSLGFDNRRSAVALTMSGASDDLTYGACVRLAPTAHL